MYVVNSTAMLVKKVAIAAGLEMFSHRHFSSEVVVTHIVAKRNQRAAAKEMEVSYKIQVSQPKRARQKTPTAPPQLLDQQECR